MTDRPLVSIALCIYNGERFLEQQLETLVNQTYPNIEFVIVDDGSADQSLAIINKYLNDERVKLYLNDTNLGYVKNFEKAIKYCTGDYIALADQDDLWHPDKVRILMDQIEDSVLIYHDSAFIDADEKVLGKMSDLLNMYSGTSPVPFLFYNCISGHSCLFKKELVSKLGSFDPRFHHDWWIAFVAGNTGKIKYVDQPLVRYRQHDLSNTDILNIREKTSHPKYSEMNLPWLRNCQRIAGKYAPFIKNIIYLHTNRNFVNSCKLLGLLFGHYHDLYYLKKKGRLSKLNYIRKMVFYYREHYQTLL